MAQYIRKDEVKTRGSAQNPYDLPEVIVVARRTYQYSYSLPIYCFYSSGGSGGGGGSGSTEDYGNHSLNNINDPGNKAKPTPVPPTTDSTNIPAYKFNLEEEIGMDENFKDSKANCVKKRLEKSKDGKESLLNELLAGFKLDKSKINIIYKTGTVLDKSTGGSTHPDLDNIGGSVSGKIIVTIDLDNWMNQTSIGLAYTVLHETLHAYLFGQKWAKDLHKEAGGVEVSFADLWEEYESIYRRDQTQHQFMATHYIEPMKKAMKSYFEQLSYYDSFMNYVADNTEWKGVDAMMEALVWRGMKETEAWKSLSEATKKEIDKQDNLFLREDSNKSENCE